VSFASRGRRKKKGLEKSSDRALSKSICFFATEKKERICQKEGVRGTTEKAAPSMSISLPEVCQRVPKSSRSYRSEERGAKGGRGDTDRELKKKGKLDHARGQANLRLVKKGADEQLGFSPIMPRRREARTKEKGKENVRRVGDMRSRQKGVGK